MSQTLPTVSVVVPAIQSNVDHDLPRLLGSIGRQAHAASETVVVLSGVNSTACTSARRTL